MGTNIYRRYKVDINKDTAVGILLPMNNDRYEKLRTQNYQVPIRKNVGPFRLSFSTEEQAVSNLTNLILTRKGERYMQPKFGTLVPEYVFEQNSRDNQVKLEQSLKEDIAFWLPYIFVKRLTVNYGDKVDFPSSDIEHGLSIKILFSVGALGAEKEVTFLLNGSNVEIIA